MDCETNSAILWWEASEGAMEYFGFAQPAVGEPLYCDSTDSSCTIEGLECGSHYNFSVASSDGTCNSSSTAALQAGAGEQVCNMCLQEDSLRFKTDMMTQNISLLPPQLRALRPPLTSGRG